MAAVVLREIHGNVGVATLNRPSRLNAWTQAMQTQLYDAFEAFESNPIVRVIVVTGAGRGFCAGADLSGLDSLASGGSGPSSPSSQQQQQPDDNRSFLLPMHIKKPIIAAVNGPVAGMGFGFALTCDMRFSNKNAKWCGAFSKRGLIAEWGTSFLLPRLVGTGNAMMFMMSSDVYLGDEAMRLGMVQKVFDGDVLSQTIAYAQKLSDNVSPTSLAAMKRQLWEHPLLPNEEALRQSNIIMKQSLQPSNIDFKEGVKSFLEKRPPKFPTLNRKNPVLVATDMLFKGPGAKL